MRWAKITENIGTEDERIYYEFIDESQFADYLDDPFNDYTTPEIEWVEKPPYEWTLEKIGRIDNEIATLNNYNEMLRKLLI